MVFPAIVKGDVLVQKGFVRPPQIIVVPDPGYLSKSFAYLIQQLSRRQANDFSYLPFPQFQWMEGWLSWSKAPDSKSGVAAMLPWVRIPPLPPQNQRLS